MEFAADLETPVSAFLKLKPLHPVFLLESVEQNEAIGRYSFIGIRPQRILTLDAKKGMDPHRTSAFFDELQQITSEFSASPGFPLPALVGFFSYEISELFHPKLNLKPASVPYAGFVLPAAVLIFDHLKHRVFLRCMVPDQEKELEKEIARCFRIPFEVPLPGKSTPPQANISRNDYCGMVDKAREHIAAGDIFQAVLSMQFGGESEVHPFQMYRALRMINPSPYMFYLDFPGSFQFFGSSPETLVKRSGNKITLRPIAGTRPRGYDAAADLALQTELEKDEKEKAEHLMLLDLARNDAGKIAKTGTVTVPKFLQVERFSHVMHLVSTVEAEANARAASLHDFFQAVFPAGTVSGAPKLRAMQIISELEPHSRGLYAGSLGYFGASGDLDHCLSIRCLQVTQGKYSFTAGAGIVADSDPGREYEEVLNKSMALQRMLQVVEAEL